MNVSAVVVTRGDVDLAPVLDSLPADWQKVVWDNSAREDMGVYGRYAAIRECDHDVIYVQDDDCVLGRSAIEDLVEAWRVPSWGSRNYVVANMPQRFRDTAFYGDHALVGFGAVFHRDLPERAFLRVRGAIMATRFARAYRDRWFCQTCDIVFTALTPRILIDVPYTDREFASAPNRMWKQPDHLGERTRMLDLVRQVRDQ